ncbi:MAG: DUF2252 domain-containing protein [Deltaproteobacteria bacterium]|nr:MAG: DUF2252 domain-containing protein [Deltaproteobacteria bacterium]TMQ18110.1 MAG: DUF2252 domain-containing protein [Deltaproteobacteria bacterium]
MAVERASTMGAPPLHRARAEREAFGRRLRDRVRRVDHDVWVSGERDVIARLRGNEEHRIRELLPYRHGRMAASPFAFLRGGAAIMAPDLAALPHTGYTVQICGDAHVRNLGAYASPEGRIVFDVNDFDETCRAPWEWDVKRLAISIVLVGREAGVSERVAREAVMAMVRSWRETLHELADLPAVELGRYCVHRFAPEGPVGRVLRKAERMTPLQARDELTAPSHDGKPRFVANPPKLSRVPDAEAQAVLGALPAYRDTLAPNHQQVLDCYLAYDVAFKVAGTGSIGGRNYVVLCVGNGIDDPLTLQVKQALPSCYEALGLVAADPRLASHHGKRVAEGQHRLQTWTDPLLGWTSIDDAPFYVRQLSDHKASIDPADLRRSSLIEYARVCGETFAKAHGRTGDAAVLYGYAGQADKLDRAIAVLAGLGADQVTADWEALGRAIERGDFEARDLD